MRDSIVWDDCRIARGVTLERCIVAHGVRVEGDSRDEVLDRTCGAEAVASGWATVVERMASQHSGRTLSCGSPILIRQPRSATLLAGGCTIRSTPMAAPSTSELARRRVISVFLIQGLAGLIVMSWLTWLRHDQTAGILRALGGDAPILIAIFVLFATTLALLKFELTELVYVVAGHHRLHGHVPAPRPGALGLDRGGRLHRHAPPRPACRSARRRSRGRIRSPTT